MLQICEAQYKRGFIASKRHPTGCWCRSGAYFSPRQLLVAGAGAPGFKEPKPNTPVHPNIYSSFLNPPDTLGGFLFPIHIYLYKMKHQTVYTDNRKAYFNFEILETIEAGIELLGFEVKAIKKGLSSLDGAYIIVRGGEAFLVKAKVSPFQQANTPKDYDPLQNRKLILHKKEIKQLSDIEAGKGKSIIPLALYNNKNRIKVEVAIVRGKKQFDKRESIKKRETDIEIRREFKR